MASRAYLAALEVVSYRWLLLSSFSQAAAMTAESLATGWLVLELTDSPLWLGVIVGVRGLSQVLFSVLGGAFVDRVDLRVLLVRNQVLCASIWAVVLVLVQTEHIAVWHLVVVQVAAGGLNAVNAPAQNALTYASVGPRRLLNAKAFGYMGGSVFRILAALVGGYGIAAFGLGAAYALVVVAYVIGSVVLLPAEIAATARAVETPLASLIGGLRYAARTPLVRAVLSLSLVAELFGFSYQYMLPVVARDVLEVGTVGLGYLSAAAGAGQLLAMIVLAAHGDIQRKGRLLVGSTCAFGAGIVLFATAGSLSLAFAALLLVGGAAAAYDSAIATVIQMITAPALRGRMLGLLVATWGTNQVGGFGLGALAALFGAPAALGVCGAVVALNAVRLAPRAATFDHRTPGLPTEAEPA